MASAVTSHSSPPVGHIRELLEFISTHQWVWDVQVTRIFQLDWLDRIPQEVGERRGAVAVDQLIGWEGSYFVCRAF